MKVVLFCGGMGLRMRGLTQALPKPMVLLGRRPILWHLMSYYAHYGHNEFILCLGHKGQAVRDFFENTAEWLSLHAPGCESEAPAIRREIAGWNITLVDTGEDAKIGERLLQVRRLVSREDAFLANYSDGLTTCPLPHLVQRFRRSEAVATMLACRPSTSFHFVSTCAGGVVTRIGELGSADLRVNAGFFVLHRQIFDFMRPGEELVEEPFGRLIEAGKLAAHEYDGFWRCVDTPKDLAVMEGLRTTEGGPWEIWRKSKAEPRKPARVQIKPPILPADILRPLVAAHDPA